jgi:hypothetical protein
VIIVQGAEWNRKREWPNVVLSECNKSLDLQIKLTRTIMLLSIDGKCVGRSISRLGCSVLVEEFQFQLLSYVEDGCDLLL